MTANPHSPTYHPMRPAFRFFTDCFHTGELWDRWAAERVLAGRTLFASPKVDGLRAVLWSGPGRGGGLRARLGNTGKIHAFDGVRFPGGCVVEGVYRDAVRGRHGDAETEGHRVTASPRHRVSACPHFWLFDLLVDDCNDMYYAPYAERLAALRRLRLDPEHFTVLEQRPVASAPQLAAEGTWAAAHPLSEGLYLRQAAAPYVFGTTPTAASLKGMGMPGLHKGDPHAHHIR